MQCQAEPVEAGVRINISFCYTFDKLSVTRQGPLNKCNVRLPAPVLSWEPVEAGVRINISFCYTFDKLSVTSHGFRLVTSLI